VMVDRLGVRLFAERDPAAVMHDRVTQELTLSDDRAELRLDLPFATRGDVSLKKIGLELVVRVDGHKRTIMLPGALAGFRPASASLAGGELVVGFAPAGEPARV
jgi:arsenite-transporting ATPase